MKITLRKKVILAFSCFVLIGSLLWFLNYYKHDILNKKLQIIEEKNILFNTILEARRYEKNYFLSQNANSLKEALEYINQAEKKYNYIIENYKNNILTENLDKSIDELLSYKQSIISLKNYQKNNNNEIKNQEDPIFLSEIKKQVRTLGKIVTDDVERMAMEERKYVKRLIKESRLYHFLALTGIIVLCVLAVLFLVYSVNRPLKAIEDAIHKIAQGDYENIPSIGTGDEFESLVSSLNNMINELSRRNEQLIQAKKLASLGTLTSGVAHELNNPLNNISTSVQILLEELEEVDIDYMRELMVEVEKEIDRARDIVRALLEFSRERTFSLKAVRIKELVDNTIMLIKGEFPSDIDLEMDVPDDIRGKMDSRRIQQVLLNLILNGIQAMENGGTLRIRAREEEDGKVLCLQIQDTGKGIGPDVLPRIFDPFFTTRNVSGSPRSASASTSVVEQSGTGLGLSICHGIVERHGGRIEVRSMLGEGTIFSIYLPQTA